MTGRIRSTSGPDVVWVPTAGNDCPGRRRLLSNPRCTTGISTKGPRVGGGSVEEVPGDPPRDPFGQGTLTTWRPHKSRGRSGGVPGQGGSSPTAATGVPGVRGRTGLVHTTPVGVGPGRRGVVPDYFFGSGRARFDSLRVSDKALHGHERRHPGNVPSGVGPPYRHPGLPVSRSKPDTTTPTGLPLEWVRSDPGTRRLRTSSVTSCTWNPMDGPGSECRPGGVTTSGPWDRSRGSV